MGWAAVEQLAESGGRLLLCKMFMSETEGRGRPAERREGFQTEGKSKSKGLGVGA